VLINQKAIDVIGPWKFAFHQERRLPMKRKLFFYFTVWVVLMQTLAWGAIAASPAPPTIPVGALVSLSGFDSNLGNQAKAGYEIAAEDINRTGGIFVKEYGKKMPLDIIIQNMESDRTKAVSRMEWLNTSKKIVAYVGTTMIDSGAGVAEKNRVPAIVTISPVQRTHERGLRYWFSPSPKPPDYAKIMFDILETIPPEKRFETVAILEEQSTYGVEMAEYFKKESLQRRFKVVSYEKYTVMSKELSPAIMAAKNAGAEVLLTCPVTPDAMLMMRQMKELDYNPKALVLLRGAEDLSWGKAMGPTGEYVILYGGWHHRVNFQGADKLNVTYQSKFGRPADVITGPAYASIQILAAAIEKAGTLDTTKIRDALAETDMMTVVGKVKFRPNGTLIDPCPAVIQWLGGSQKLVWPKEFRETPFVYPIPLWKDRVF
jgi:branched-chain amino acid transport system substrate-binding protein